MAIMLSHWHNLSMYTVENKPDIKPWIFGPIPLLNHSAKKKEKEVETTGEKRRSKGPKAPQVTIFYCIFFRPSATKDHYPSALFTNNTNKTNQVLNLVDLFLIQDVSKKE